MRCAPPRNGHARRSIRVRYELEACGGLQIVLSMCMSMHRIITLHSHELALHVASAKHGTGTPAMRASSRPSRRLRSFNGTYAISPSTSTVMSLSPSGSGHLHHHAALDGSATSRKLDCVARVSGCQLGDDGRTSVLFDELIQHVALAAAVSCPLLHLLDE